MPVPKPLDFQSLGHVRVAGRVWMLSCNYEQTHSLLRLLGTAGHAIAAPGGRGTIACLTAARAYIARIDDLGGSNGVDITGVIGARGIIVTPRWGKVFETLMTAGRLEPTGGTIIDFILDASLDDTVIEDAFCSGDHETFTLAHLGEGDEVALLPQLGPWEIWKLIANANGTLSLQNAEGHFLCAAASGRVCHELDLVGINGGDQIAFRAHVTSGDRRDAFVTRRTSCLPTSHSM